MINTNIFLLVSDIWLDMSLAIYQVRERAKLIVKCLCLQHLGKVFMGILCTMLAIKTNLKVGKKLKERNQSRCLVKVAAAEI